MNLAPYGWWIPFLDRSLVESLFESLFKLHISNYEIGDGRYEVLFSFVAKEEKLSEGISEPGTENTSGPGSAVFQLNQARFNDDLRMPTHEFALDSINAQWFIEQSAGVPECEINGDINSREKRLGRLREILLPDRTPIVSVLFSEKSPEESSYIDNFQPSTWHRVIIGPAGGVPAIRAGGGQIEEGEPTRLVYAGPTTRVESELLFEIISLNHILDVDQES